MAGWRSEKNIKKTGKIRHYGIIDPEKMGVTKYILGLVTAISGHICGFLPMFPLWPWIVCRFLEQKLIFQLAECIFIWMMADERWWNSLTLMGVVDRICVVSHKVSNGIGIRGSQSLLPWAVPGGIGVGFHAICSNESVTSWVWTYLKIKYPPKINDA